MYCVKRTHFKAVVLLLVFGILCTGSLFGAKIGDLGEADWVEQALRFFTFQDAAVVYAFVGTGILGLGSGVLGSFMYVRGRSLLSDTLSHAMLPGLTIAFLIFLEKEAWVLFLGALGSALLGSYAIDWLKRNTKLKEDAVLGVVLAGFYAVGITILTLLQNNPISSQAGLDKFLFGQASALSIEDVVLIGIVCGASISLIGLFYRFFLVVSFDQQWSQSVGIKEKLLNTILMLLVCMMIVVGAKAVGIILISAILIIPACIGRLLSKRLKNMIFIASLTGMLCAMTGTFISFLNFKYPTGPFIVLVSTLVFILTVLFRAKKGLFYRWIRKEEPSVH